MPILISLTKGRRRMHADEALMVKVYDGPPIAPPDTLALRMLPRYTSVGLWDSLRSPVLSPRRNCSLPEVDLKDIRVLQKKHASCPSCSSNCCLSWKARVAMMIRSYKHQAGAGCLQFNSLRREEASSRHAKTLSPLATGSQMQKVNSCRPDCETCTSDSRSALPRDQHT